MSLAAYGKNVKFLSWPYLQNMGVYTTPEDCMFIRSLSWDIHGSNVVVVKASGHPVFVIPPTKVEETIEPYKSIKKSGINVATFSKTRSSVVGLGYESGEINLYDIRSKRIVYEYKKLPKAIQNLEFSNGDEITAAGLINGQILIYNSNENPCASLMVPSSYSLTTLVFSKWVPELLAGASKEGLMSVWDVSRMNNKLIGKHHNSTVTDVDFSSADVISSVGMDGRFVTYDLRTAHYQSCYCLECSIYSMAFCPNNFEVALATTANQVRTYDPRFMKGPIYTHNANQNIKKICFGPCTEDTIRDSSDAAKSTTSELNFPYENPLPASGDFTNFSDSCSVASYNNKSITTKDIPASVSAANINPPEEKLKISEVREFSKNLEEEIKNYKGQFEERLIQNFYGMRINISKQFIVLEEKVNQSWNGFVEYLRTTGAESNSESNYEPLGSKSSEESSRVLSLYRKSF